MTDNEKIAKFMDGFRLQIPRNMWHIKSRNQTLDSEDMKYDTSWDWLMPVVEKINSLGFTISINFQSVRNACDTSIFNRHMSEQIFNEEQKSIDATYKTVIQFIDWYETQNK